MTQSGQPIRPLTFSRLPNGEAGIGECIIKELVNQYGSPLYVMDQKTIITNCQEYTNGLAKYYPQFKLMYAGKANLTIGLLDLLASKGIGVDVVSGGELYTALQSQMNPENITFHGNNKSIEELQLAIDHQVTIVLDNFQELEASIQISKNSKILTIISPSKRYYHVSKIITTEAGIYRNWFQDFYLVIGSEKDGKWGVKMYLNPMVNLIWIGVMLMIYSGLLGIRRK